MHGHRRGPGGSGRHRRLQVVAAVCTGVVTVAGLVALQPGALTTLRITESDPSFLRPGGSGEPLTSDSGRTTAPAVGATATPRASRLPDPAPAPVAPAPSVSPSGVAPTTSSTVPVPSTRVRPSTAPRTTPAPPTPEPIPTPTPTPTSTPTPTPTPTDSTSSTESVPDASTTGGDAGGAVTDG